MKKKVGGGRKEKFVKEKENKNNTKQQKKEGGNAKQKEPKFTPVKVRRLGISRWKWVDFALIDTIPFFKKI